MAEPAGWDYAWWRPTLAQLRAGGVQFVSRYLSWLPNGKVLTRAEYQALRAAGIDVCLNWEFSAQDMKRGYNGGLTDAREALRQVRALGITTPTPIYFSADWDASQYDFDHYIKPYLQAVASVLGGPQYVGIYGSYATVKRAMQAGLVKYGWQTYAWSYGAWYVPPGHVRQVRNGLGGGNYDLDYAYSADFGQVGGPVENVPLSGVPVAVYGRTLRVPKPAEDGNMQLELNKTVVFACPALASGYKQWVSLTTDLGDAEIRFAYRDDTGWHLVGSPTDTSNGEARILVSAAGGDVSWPVNTTKVRKFSVTLTKMSTENGVAAVDVLPTPVPVDA